jgi:signal transduction histidine kinase
VKSLREQLTLRLLLGGTLLLGAAGMGIEWQIRHALTAEFDTTLRAAVQYLGTFTEIKIGGLKIEQEGAALPQYEHANSGEVFLLRTVNGDEVQRATSLGDATLPHRPVPPDTMQYFDARLPDGRVLRCVSQRFFPEMAKKAREGNVAPVEVVLTVGHDRALLDRTLTTLRAALWSIGAISLGALAALVRWGVGSGLRPLDRLGEGVAQVNANALETRFPTGEFPAELRPIAARLNELLERLEQSFERERRFTTNVAHELRTPLTELRALAEVNLATPASEDERSESWRDALASTHRMEVLSLRLLELARAEDPSDVIQRKPVELERAVRDAWRPWASRAVERGIDLDLAIPAGLTVLTDAALLEVILGNLFGNATEHAPAGAPLRLEATRNPGAITLELSNRAGDLTLADVPHLFERFWKKDASRTDARHHGLGLSLASEFAELLGGRLTASLSDGEIHFSLRLPGE